MQSISTSGVQTPPPSIQNLQAAHITARVSASAAVAGLLASMAFGAARRDDDAALASLTAARVGRECR